jgi:hypothetical protein
MLPRAAKIAPAHRLRLFAEWLLYVDKEDRQRGGEQWLPPPRRWWD